MKKLLTIIVSCCFLSGAFAQSIERQVISTAGGNGTSGSALLSWTIGETVVKTSATSDAEPFYQGFQMPIGVANFQELSLNRGWNYVSSYINTTASMESIFAESGLPWNIASGVLVINKVNDDYSLQQVIPGEGALNWQPMLGYQVYSNSNTPITLHLTGKNITTTKKTFGDGWSMIPMFVKDKNINTRDFFEAPSVEGKAFLIRSIDGQASVYVNDDTMTPFVMEIGKAYDVYFVDAPSAEVNYSEMASAKSAANDFRLPETPWNAPVANVNPHTVVFTSDALASLQYGDVLAAFTPNGYCAGVVAYSGQGNAMLVNGNSIELSIDGFNAGETMDFRVYRPSTNEIFDVTVDFDNAFSGAEFEANGVSVVKSVNDVEGIGEYGITEVALYPNPAVSTINLTVTGNLSNSAVAYIYSLEDGRTYGQVQVSANTQINVANLEPGVYCVKVVDADQVIVKKFVKN